MMNIRASAPLLLITVLSTATLAATQTHRGTAAPPHPNPLMQPPAAIATINVSSAQNFRASKVTVVWRMKPNTIATRRGSVEVPSMLARGEEFALHLVDPSGNVWPVSRPVMYASLLGTQTASVKVSEVAALAEVGEDEEAIDLSELGSAVDEIPPETLDQPPVSIEDIALAVSLVGPQLDEHGYISYADNGQPETRRIPCAQATWHRSAQRGGIFPTCAIEDIRAFRASYEDQVDFSARARTVVFEFPREVSTYGLWQLVAVDTRPLEHDLVSLSMIPLNSSPEPIQPVSTEPPRVPHASFSRMQFDTAGVVFEGTPAPLPDTGPRTERFRNELVIPVTDLLDAVSPNLPENINPSLPDVTIPNLGQPSAASTAVTAGIEAAMARRARHGANRIVMSGLRLHELTLNLELAYVGESPRPDVSLRLESPPGVEMLLGRNVADGNHSFAAAPAEGNLPLQLLDKPIDGTWRILVRDASGNDVSRDFSFEAEAAVTGPGTDFFIVQEFDEPVVAENGQRIRRQFRIDDSRPIRKLWFRAFSDNFVGFRHEVTLRAPNGRRIRSCLATSADGPCIEVGSDGIGKIVNVGNEIAPRGIWTVDWRVLKADDLLSERTEGGIAGGVCEATDLQAHNDPSTSAQGIRQDNPLGVGAAQFNHAWLASQSSVSLGGFLVGFGETPPNRMLMEHSFLDKAEDGVWNKPWFERSSFTRGFWDHLKTVRDLRSRHLPEEYQAFFDQTIGLMQQRQLNRLSVFQSAGIGGFLIDRLLDGQDLLGDIRAFDAYQRGLSDWNPESAPVNQQGRDALSGIHGLTASVPFGMDDDLSFYLQGGAEDIHLGQLFTAFVTTAGGTGFVAAGTCTTVITIGTSGAGTVPSAPGCAAFGFMAGVVGGGGRVAYDVYRHYDQEADDQTGTGGGQGGGGTQEEEDAGAEQVSSVTVCYDEIGCVTMDGDGALKGADNDGTYHLNGRKYECVEGSCSDVAESDQDLDEGELQYQAPEEVDFTDDEDTDTSGNGEDDEDDSTSSTDDESTECPPQMDGCGEVPPQSWFDQYLAASQGQPDPFIAHWGNFAPYINCGPDGCATGIVPETNLGSQGLDPWVNCDAEGVTCGQDAIGKACTSFNWADTFTDPPPDGGPVIGDPNDPDDPDCTDASNPCEDPDG